MLAAMLRESVPGWRLEMLSDGIALVPREGVLEGAIRIRERQRPLRSAPHVFAEALARVKLSACSPAPLEVIVTCEGEHAAFQKVLGEISGEPMLRCFGAVFGDDFYTFIDAGTVVPRRFAELEHNARVYTSYVALGLGHRRVRRFRYRPPRDWQPLERGLDMRWLPPGYPASTSTSAIAVYAARPAAGSRKELLLDVLANERLGGPSAGEPAASTPVFVESGLAGSKWEIEGSDMEIAIFEDERFLYPLVAIGPEARAVFDKLLHTVHGIPLPEPTASQDSMLHWAT